MRRRVLATVTTATVFALGGLAYAQSPPADPSVAPARPARSDRPERPRPLFGAIHGELVVPAPQQPGGYRQVVFDRGRLTSLTGDAITLERPDGRSVGAAVTAETGFHGTPREQLEPGDPVLVVHAGGAALRVVSRRPCPHRTEAPGQAQADGDGPGCDRRRAASPAGGVRPGRPSSRPSN
jgi:hypothetical protein